MLIERCPWYVAGPLLGLLIVGVRATVNKPLGGLGGYIDLAQSRGRWSRLGFRAYLLAGLLLGGVGYALVSGQLHPHLVYGTRASLLPTETWSQLLYLAAAGLVMGFGAKTAGGCTSGHGMCGVSVGSKASVVATATFMASAVALAHLLNLFTGSVR